MAEQRAEVAAIAAGAWPPAFEETIAALERSGRPLHLAERLLGDASGTGSPPGSAVGADDLAAFRRIPGREPSVGPLLERRGPA